MKDHVPKIRVIEIWEDQDGAERRVIERDDGARAYEVRSSGDWINLDTVHPPLGRTLLGRFAENSGRVKGTIWFLLNNHLIIREAIEREKPESLNFLDTIVDAAKSLYR